MDSNVGSWDKVTRDVSFNKSIYQLPYYQLVENNVSDNAELLSCSIP